MNKQEKEKLSIYGKLVCDFANGDKTDKILSDYFKNLQFAFGFSKDFQEKALAQYPIKGMSVGFMPYRFFHLLTIRDKGKGKQGKIVINEYRVKQYNPLNQMFTIENRKPGEFDNHDKNAPSLIPLSNMDEYLDKINTPRIQKEIIIELANIYDLKKIEEKPWGKYTNFERIALHNISISNIHLSISDTNEKLNSFLLQLTESDNPYETNEFHSILSRYNKIPRMECIVSDDHRLVDNSPFTEDYFLDEKSLLRKSDYYPEEEQGWLPLEIFVQPVWYCLIEFLKNPEYSGADRIAKCDDCLKLFAKTKLYDNQIYCSDCSKRSHVDRDTQKKRTENTRIAKRNKKRKELYENQYKRLLDSGHSPKEAEQKAKEYYIEQMGEKEKFLKTN